MIVVDGHLVTQEQRGEADAVVCYDAATGEELWVHTDEDRFNEPLSGPGPRSTPSFDGGRIVTVGGRGRLNCLDAASGKLLWTHENAVAVAQWGLATSPLLTDDLVIVFAGGKNERSLVAYRVDNGDTVWERGVGHTSYSSPQLVTLGGQRQILIDDTAGLHSVAVESGELLWEHLTGGGPAEPMLQPHVISDHELTVAWNSGIARLKVERKDGQWTVSRQWETTALKPGFNDFVIHEGHIFGLDDGILCCLDAASGQRLWKKGRFGHGQLLLLASPPRLIVVAESGEMALLAANPKQCEELGRFKAIDGKCWNHPVIAHGCLFVRNGEEMACYRLQQVTSDK
jgi:outer membrane protein assembly factor BamB